MVAMKTIKAIKGKIKIPKEFQLSKEKRRLHIKMPYQSMVETLDKDNFRVTSRNWFRSKQLNEKPFIPEGFIEIDKIRFKVLEV